MCNNTKQRIADAMRQLMNERSFDKITVQNLMDMTSMKRQSFYYHFQDTRDVLMWICRQEIIEPLADSRLEFVDWLLQALELLDRDRRFYRRLPPAARQDFLLEFGPRVLMPRITTLLYPGENSQSLDSNQQFVVDFAVQAVSARLMGFVESRRPLDLQAARERAEYLLNAVLPLKL